MKQSKQRPATGRSPVDVKTETPRLPVAKVREDLERLQQKFPPQGQTASPMKIRTANECMEEASRLPMPHMLFDELWYEGEVCLLFADTNLGKSILAVQIADAISRGVPIRGFRMEGPAQKVLYFDFELSDKQFEIRYSIRGDQPYRFHENLYRAKMDLLAEMPDQFEDFEQWVLDAIEQSIAHHPAKVLIVDNLTFLGTDLDKRKEAQQLMRKLSQIKEKYRVSLLVMAHSRKRDQSKPIQSDDLAGSKMIQNFADTAFAIGKSFIDHSVRYLVQLKSRNAQKKYAEDNVIECRILKQGSFLQFELTGYGRESAHLRSLTDQENDKLEQQILDLWESEPDLSLRKMGDKLGVSHMKVERTLKKHKKRLEDDSPESDYTPESP